jgi:hypothetical protein
MGTESESIFVEGRRLKAWDGRDIAVNTRRRGTSKAERLGYVQPEIATPNLRVRAKHKAAVSVRTRRGEVVAGKGAVVVVVVVVVVRSPGRTKILNVQLTRRTIIERIIHPSVHSSITTIGI